MIPHDPDTPRGEVRSQSSPFFDGTWEYHTYTSTWGIPFPLWPRARSQFQVLFTQDRNKKGGGAGRRKTIYIDTFPVHENTALNLQLYASRILCTIF